MLQNTLPVASGTSAGRIDPRKQSLRDSHATADSRSTPANALRNSGVPAPLAFVRTPSALPMEAQGNVEPELWSLLDLQEREFFADAAPGALSYSPGRLTTTPPAARGLRLDIRA